MGRLYLSVDEIVDERSAVRRRVGLHSELFLCPTFPVGPKRGGYANSPIWMRELADEQYLQPEEFETALEWHDRWLQIFADLDSPERAALRGRLSEMVTLIAHQRWEELHAFMFAVHAAGQ